VQPERPAPSPVPTNMNQAAGNQAFVGVVPSPTPSNVLGGGPSINMNSSLLDQQFSNVMRMPTPALAQSMFVVLFYGCCCYSYRIYLSSP
jgi:hypothetical protein